MIIGKSKFGDESDIKGLICECEESFEKQLKNASDSIIYNSSKIITICGPTCSGKTTTANKLMSYLHSEGKRVHVVSFDDFYKDRDEIERICKEKGVAVEFESASTLDLDLLKKVFLHVANGDDVDIPKFDFRIGKRDGYVRYHLSDDDLFIFEGIQALYDEVACLYADFSHFSIYICTEDGIKFDDVEFDKETIRLLRRIVRDSKHRNTSAAFTYGMWKSVRENEEENIFPNTHKADFYINSTLRYEPNVIKGDALRSLSNVPPSDEFYEKSKQIISMFDKIQEISEDYVPHGSVLREFID